MVLKFDTQPGHLVEAIFPDIDDLCATVRLWDLDLRPLSVPKPGGAVGHLVQFSCGPLEYGYCKLTACFDQFGSPPSGLLTFAILEESMHRYWWRGHDVDQNYALVYPIGSELQGLNGSDFEVHTISVSHETIGSICEGLKITLPQIGLLPEIFRLEPNLLNALREQFRRIHNHAPPQSTDSMLRIVEVLVLAWLRQTNIQPQPRPSLRNRDRAVRQCLELIEQTEMIGLSPRLLREASGVSERTLQYAFRERFGLTPAAFLKARRLTATRHQLLSAGNGDSKVGDIAAEFGFWHLGHFASDYHMMFGESPSATQRRIRAVC